jgi:hypothetical protein
MRGFPQRVLICLAGFVAIAAILGGCPHPGPAPVTPPDAADASPATMDAARPVSCDTACRHAEKVCPGSGSPCGRPCNRIGAEYARCVNAATGCKGPSGVAGCDPLNGASAGAPHAQGQ